jgi:hypothetical protein
MALVDEGKREFLENIAAEFLVKARQKNADKNPISVR